jgi:hypothetical protein
MHQVVVFSVTPELGTLLCSYGARRTWICEKLTSSRGRSRGTILELHSTEFLGESREPMSMEDLKQGNTFGIAKFFAEQGSCESVFAV